MRAAVQGRTISSFGYTSTKTSAQVHLSAVGWGCFYSLYLMSAFLYHFPLSLNYGYGICEWWSGTLFLCQCSGWLAVWRVEGEEGGDGGLQVL